VNSLSYLTIVSKTKESIDNAIKELGMNLPEFVISETPSPTLGDISANVAFPIAKETRASPHEIALRISQQISKNLPEFISRVNSHESGYINFFIDYEKVLKVLLSRKEYLKTPIAEKSLLISVEHTSVNPNKALHIGHARNVVIGDSIARILSSYGHRITVLNYIDDTGIQVADVVLGIIHLGIPAENRKYSKFDHYIGDSVYVEVNRAYEQDKSLLEKRKEVSKKIEKGEGQESIISREITRKVLKAQLETCWRLGAEYDLLNFESDILSTGYWNEIFELLKAKGIVKLQKGGKFDGCWVMQGDEDEEEKVLVRSDGTTVYAAKDIPYAAWKLGLIQDRFYYELFCNQPSGKELWSTTTVKKSKYTIDKKFGGYDKTIAVIDVGQSRLQKFVKKALLTLSEKGEQYIHLAYEKVFLSKRTAEQLFRLEIEDKTGAVSMKGRSGIYINVDNLLEELKNKAITETRKRNPNAEDAFIDRIAEDIAVSALRYELLKQDLNKVIIFDIDESLKLEGDTAPYLMYSYARASSILSKAWQIDSSSIKIPAQLTQQEKNLILQISKFGYEFLQAVDYLNPKPIVRYSYNLAVAFNNFYEKCPVLTAPKDIADFRIAIVDAFRAVMTKALDLIGIRHPEAI